jgi:cation diffusion facilitator CzcD-associated flavoprotein CzcO
MSLANQHIAIIGSGFAGIGLAIRLKLAGRDDFTIFERASSLGGVWRDNTYPGVACDVPAHLYSYSFEPNPNWSRFFSPQSEILAYLQRCAAKYDVMRHIRFESEVASATFDEDDGLWTVMAAKEVPLVARFLVSAAGHALSVPVVPTIPGASDFAGVQFHSARWNHQKSLRGKRVSVIGTGASAIQIVPNIIDQVAGLTLYQRTAPWVLPRNDSVISSAAQARMQKLPILQAALRGGIYSFMESFALGFVVAPRVNGWREQRALRYLERAVPDVALRQKLQSGFRLGCKRILYSDTYYPALQQPHAEVVTTPIQAVTRHGIVDGSGRERPCDAIVYATGFEASEVAAPFPIVGRVVDGVRVDIDRAWQDGIEAYLGTTIAGLPNYFMMLGPNTGLGHSSMIYMMESQMNYLLDAFRYVARRGLSWVDVKAIEQRHFNDGIAGRMRNTVWATGCNSWYRRADGKNTTLWPGFTFEFRRRTKRFDAQRYVCR